MPKMIKAVVAKGKSGLHAVSSDGESVTISDKASVSSLEKLIEERQKIGVKISKELKSKGLHSLSEEEPTQAIEE
jgi:hypothetical protein